MAKHQAPERHHARDRAAVRSVTLAMIGLTLFVIAMIAAIPARSPNQRCIT